MTEPRSDGAGMVSIALGLAKNLATGTTRSGRNLVFSPLSIYTALALVAEGADGATLKELLAALGAGSRHELAASVRGLAERALTDQSRSGGPAVAFACGVWHDSDWTPQPGFCEVAAESYKAMIREVDFRNKPEAAIREINSWVAETTNNLINSIVDRSTVNRNTSLVLANAIYFKGKWTEPFNKEHTKPDKFYRLDGSIASDNVQFMRSWNRQFIDVRDGYKVLRLQYRSPLPPQQNFWSPGWNVGNDFARYSMYVYLPDSRDGLPALVEKITSNPTRFQRDNWVQELVPVGDFRLPRFKLTFSDDISPAMKDGLGIKTAFHEYDADLSDMAEPSKGAAAMPLSMVNVRHKAVIEVNEEGTEAAAATMCLMAPGCTQPRTPPKIIDFVADHPFMFFVIEEVSCAIVFAGTVLDPSA